MSRTTKRHALHAAATAQGAAQRPEFVYKYSPISQYFLDGLQRSSFWFTHREKLNDPFDCKIEVSDVLFVREGYPREHFGLLRAAASEAFIWGVCCFTLDPTSHLMWSHYADGHKGVCLEFRTRRSQLLCNRLRPVTYSDERRVIQTMDEFTQKAFFCKTTHWAYEKEWRLLGGGDAYLHYPRVALSAVIFGAKASSESVKNVVSVCRKANYRRTRFFQILANPHDSTLTREPLSAALLGGSLSYSGLPPHPHRP